MTQKTFDRLYKLLSDRGSLQQEKASLLRWCPQGRESTILDTIVRQMKARAEWIPSAIAATEAEIEKVAKEEQSTPCKTAAQWYDEILPVGATYGRHEWEAIFERIMGRSEP